MKGRKLCHQARALVVIGVSLIAITARAEFKTFTIDQTQSALTISGSFSGFAFQQQGPGSLTTTYTGNINADVTDSNITFTGGSMIVARTNGNWQPAPGGAPGAAPANYGGQVVNILVNGQAAIRDLVLDLTGGPVTVTGATFPAQGLVFNFPLTATSVIDYTYSSVLIGSASGSRLLDGSSTNNVSTNATLTTQGAETVLTIPVDITGFATAIDTNDIQYRLRGQIVARAPVTIPLRITSFSVAGTQLNFTIDTTPGQAYTIQGSGDLVDWSTIIDQFTATGTSTTRSVNLPALLPYQYFRVRED